MKISELVALLELHKKRHGDVPVFICDMTREPSDEPVEGVVYWAQDEDEVIKEKHVTICSC